MPSKSLEELIRLHGQLESEEIVRLRALSDKERGELIFLACEAAAIITRGRRASGLPEPSPAPWPSSTWAFLKEHAARGRS
jgi:hypothetical protein